jgi:hypothetical protein
MVASLLDLLLSGLAILAAVLLVVAMLRLGLAAHHLAEPPDAEAVPLPRLLAIGTGAVAGGGLLAAAPDLSLFHPASIFATDGPWTIGLPELLRRHALPGAAALRALPAGLSGLHGATTLAAWLAVAGLVGGGVLVRRLWRGWARLRAFGGFLLLVLLTALQLHLAVHLLAWLAAQLGFWLFALALVLFQRWRYARPSAH